MSQADRAPDLRGVPGRRGPWATLVNQVAIVHDIEITLLSYVVVDDAMRVHGAVRVTADHEALLTTVPVLELRQVGEPSPMRPLGGRVLPRPPIVWVVWMFELPGPEPSIIAARISELAFGQRIGAKPDVVRGPWLFDTFPKTGEGRGHEHLSVRTSGWE
jgi:hypothetical protein